MRFLALTPLLTLMLAPIGLHAHPHEGALPEQQFADMLRQESPGPAGAREGRAPGHEASATGPTARSRG